tara:strand:+ start:103 stop:273 length:171 start_codon:yes stop_codon:yes gene_type:complete
MTNIKYILTNILVIARREGWYADKYKQGAYNDGLKALAELDKPKPVAKKATAKKGK